MCAFRFSQFLKKDEQEGAASVENPAETPDDAVDYSLHDEAHYGLIVDESATQDGELEALDNESIKGLRGLDNIIKELGIDPDEDLAQESKFYTGCVQLNDLLHQLTSSQECKLAWSDICRKVDGFWQAIEEEFGAFWIEALDAEFTGMESFVRRHNINACIICLELAGALKYKPEERVDIAAAALLYNIGGIDAEENLSQEEEQNLLDRSVNILRKTGAPSDSLRAISECNERVDGSGTPSHLEGSQISLKGQLLGLSVAFERLFCKEQANFKAQGTAFQPVMKTLKVHRTHFNPQVLKSLLLTSGFYQVGAIVELNSGALARVITQNPGSPLRPLVEIVLDRAGNHPVRRHILDLRDNLTLSIVRTVAKGT